jgi:hypothetical protein
VEPSDTEDPNQVMVANLQAAAERYRDAPERLWAHLNTVLDDENLLRELADRSSFHPNGFVKIVLHPEASPRIRLHVWPAEAPERLVDPHGHRWAFASWIITGSLRETTYAERSWGWRFEVFDYGGTKRGEQATRRICRLAPQSTTRRRRGHVYTRDRHEVHDAHPVGGGMVASLVLQGSASDRTPVYRPSGSAETRRHAAITPDELRALLVEITAILQPVA